MEVIRYRGMPWSAARWVFREDFCAVDERSRDAWVGERECRVPWAIQYGFALVLQLFRFGLRDGPVVGVVLGNRRAKTRRNADVVGKLNGIDLTISGEVSDGGCEAAMVSQLGGVILGDSSLELDGVNWTAAP